MKSILHGLKMMHFELVGCSKDIINRIKSNDLREAIFK